jgi:Tetratricopeptide repeat
MRRVGWALLFGGRETEALQLLLDCFNDCKAIFGPEYLETAESMSYLSKCYLVLGRDDEAIVLAEESLRLRKTLGFGVENPVTLTRTFDLVE